MKILIIDDDYKFIEKLEKDLLHFFRETEDHILISKIYNKFDNVNIDESYDLLFVDIDLISENGINIAKDLRKNDSNILIIFMSSQNTLVFNTFGAKPFYFIRKSNYMFDLQYFLELLNTFIKEKTIILLNYRAVKSHITVNSIIYVESNQHILTIHTKDGVLFDNRSLLKFQEILPQSNFVRIHKSYIINLDYLEKINYYEIWMKKNINLPIGRKYRDLLTSTYQRFLIK